MHVLEWQPFILHSAICTSIKVCMGSTIVLDFMAFGVLNGC